MLSKLNTVLKLDADAYGGFTLTNAVLWPSSRLKHFWNTLDPAVNINAELTQKLRVNHLKHQTLTVMHDICFSY